VSLTPAWARPAVVDARPFQGAAQARGNQPQPGGNQPQPGGNQPLAGDTSAQPADSPAAPTAPGARRAAANPDSAAQARRAANADLVFMGGIALLGVCTLAFAGLFVRETWRGHSAEVESHWGGFGGGLGGWRVSPSLTYLVCALAFGTMVSVLVARASPAPPPSKADPRTDSTATTPRRAG
jgi:hypothetical protein